MYIYMYEGAYTHSIFKTVGDSPFQVLCAKLYALVGQTKLPAYVSPYLYTSAFASAVLSFSCFFFEFLCVNTFMHVYSRTCMYKCACSPYSFLCTSTYTYIYIYICIYLYLHVYSLAYRTCGNLLISIFVNVDLFHCDSCQ